MKKLVYEQLPYLEENNWWYKGRRKIIFAFLKRYFYGMTDLNILDAGCGAGSVMKLLERYGRVEGIDNNKFMVRYCRRNGYNVVLGDINRLPFQDKSFDLVVALEVLEHIKDDSQAVSELYRVIKDKGFLFLSAPAFPFLWGNQDLVAKHKRRYLLKELKRKLIKNGFSIQRITYINFILFPAIFTVRIMRKIFFKYKPQLDSDYFSDKPLLNNLLSFIFGLEAFIVPYLDFPFGVTLFCVAKKQNNE